jgi:hypothetical protein
MRKFLRKLFLPKQVKTEKEILSLADELKDFLMPQNIQNIYDDIEYNEFGNAFENLCIQLFEQEAPISQEIYTRIETIGKVIGYSEKYWDFLKPLIKND